MSTIDEVEAEVKSLLKDFAESVNSLGDDIQEDLDQFLEAAHRRLIVSGAKGADVTSVEQEVQNQTLHANALIGLALSGGGIRSASFSIGALQAIAEKGLLPAFHFISSVSGGGYANSWLAAWSYRHREGIKGVQKELLPTAAVDSGPLRWVRRHSAYLAPKFGSSTAGDSSALIVAYISNWLPILLLISLATTTLLLIPYCVVDASHFFSEVRHTYVSFYKYLSSASVLALLLFAGIIRRLTLFYRVPEYHSRYPILLPEIVFYGSLAISIVSCAIAPSILDGLMLNGESRDFTLSRFYVMEPQFTIALYWFLFSLGATCCALVLGSKRGQWLSDTARAVIGVKLSAPGQLVLQRIPLWRVTLKLIISSIVAAVLVTAAFDHLFSKSSDTRLIITLGPLAWFVVFSVSELAGMLFTLQHLRDVDRAWLSRLAGWMLTSISAWTLLCTFTLWSHHITAVLSMTNIGLCISIAVSLIAEALIYRYFGCAGVVSSLVLLIFLVAVSYFCLSPIDQTIDQTTNRGNVWYTLAYAIGGTIATGLVANVNRFSLHSLYKEGLVRTFLGASRLGARNTNIGQSPGAELKRGEEPQYLARKPDPVTDIDDEDNPSLAWMKSKKFRELPIFLFNAAVNGRSSTDNDGRVPRQWPFTFSQYFCGSPTSGIGYSETERFFTDSGPKGLTLGTAMAVSGAAMSPTSGRSTHPIKAFVLGILNARLGLWIGNPCYPNATNKESPLAGLTILKEILGVRSRFKRWIHLSDGGHFENLGVYELVRRGCRRIIAIDATCDPKREFSDLANTIRRVQIDLGVQISRALPWELFGPDGRSRLDSSATSGESKSWTWFDVDYGDGLPKGRLLYIKPSVYEGRPLPVDVRHYWRKSTSFPHESTADQFFTEAQMEAYRSLGRWCTRDALKIVLSLSETPKYDEDPRLSGTLLRLAASPTNL